MAAHPSAAVPEIDPATLESALSGYSDEIGRGGFGVVYRGELHGMKVAAKVLGDGPNATTQLYRQEVEMLCRLRHPHVVAVVSTCEAKRAVVMELMEGARTISFFIRYMGSL